MLVNVSLCMCVRVQYLHIFLIGKISHKIHTHSFESRPLYIFTKRKMSPYTRGDQLKTVSFRLQRSRSGKITKALALRCKYSITE